MMKAPGEAARRPPLHRPSRLLSIFPRRQRHTGDTTAGYLFIAPFFAFYGVFLVYPSIAGFWISLHRWGLLGTDISFVGLQNYSQLLQDGTFWSSLGHTLYFTLISSPALLLLGLGLALLVNRPYRGMGLFRALFYLSSVLSVSVVTTIWLKVFDPNYGLIGNLFHALHLGQPPYVFQDPTWAMPAVALVTVWWTVGTNMILFLAGLQDVPLELYEAARIDGATRWKLFLHITVPGLRRTIAFASIIQIIASMQVFGQVYNTTQGGPMGETTTLVMYIYQTSFQTFNLGYGSALSVALFTIMFALSLVQLRFFTHVEQRTVR